MKTYENNNAQELKLKESKFGISLALPLVAMQHNTLDRPATEGLMTDAVLLEEAAYWVDFAQGAYGQEDIKGYDKASVTVAIGEKPPTQSEWRQICFSGQMWRFEWHIFLRKAAPCVPCPKCSGVQMPGHFVAVDRSRLQWCVRCVCRSRKQVVLGIRGTTTLSDALTDAVGEAIQVRGSDFAQNPWRWLDALGSWLTKPCSSSPQITFLSVATKASAQAVLEKTRKTLEETLKETGSDDSQAPGHLGGFSLLITGHSLGAGTAILCAVLLSVRGPK